MKTLPPNLLSVALAAIFLLGLGSPDRAHALQFGDFTYQLINGGTEVEITGYPTTATGHVDIPATIDAKPVTSIGRFAFWFCENFTSITIPNSVTSIGYQAFFSCSSLTSIAIPNSVTSIGNDAFAFCTSLTGITIPDSVTYIGESVFARCNSLTSITIPNRVTSIQRSTFNGCNSLTSVTIPDSVTSIGVKAFFECSKLTSVTIPDSVTSIGGSAFSRCTGLTSVTIPDSVTSIGQAAFSECSSLTSVTIPDSVTSIGNSAFRGCTGLTSAYFTGDAPADFGTRVFDNTDPAFTIYYLDTATGFTMPTWNGYPTVMVDSSLSPDTIWLIVHGLNEGTDMSADLNGDGVPLLLAYALNLDPRENLAGKTINPVINGSTLQVDFFAGRPDITYRVETSTDLLNWTDTGVTLTPLDAANHRTASVPTINDRARYLRLAVSK